MGGVPDWLTKAAATKPPQEGDSPTPQPLADRQPYESLSLLEWVLRTLTEDVKRERERTNPLLAEVGQRLRPTSFLKDAQTDLRNLCPTEDSLSKTS